MFAKKNKIRGFTVIELIVVLGMAATLTGLITINLLTSQRLATLNSTITVLESDLRQQQLKSMSGDIADESTPTDHGIHFETDKYVLFPKDYISGTGNTFVVNLDGNISITTPGEIIFSQGSGETKVGSLDTVTLQDSFNNQKSLTINSLGVIISD